MSRKRILIASVLILLLAVAAWLYFHRARRVNLAASVPDSALGYLEINDWPAVVNRLTATKAWQQLAPAYGINDKLNYAGKAGWLAGLAGSGEAGLLARAQFAFVVTALEVRGERVRPHWALIAATHGSANELRAAIEPRLQDFANRVYGRASLEKSEQSGLPINVYRPVARDEGGEERALYSIELDNQWIFANNDDALRDCLETVLGRRASMANNFYLQNARATVERDGSAFGFVTGDGVERLLKFGAFLVSGGALGKAALAGAVGEVFTKFSSRSIDGIAYGASFEGGGVVDRYSVLFKPELVDAVKSSVKPSASESHALDVIPQAATAATVIKVVNPMKALDGIEAAISARVGIAQSFLLHQFLIGAREIFFGIKQGSQAAEAIGDEIASFDLPESAGGEAQAEGDESQPNRVWLVAIRNQALILQIVKSAMVARGAQMSVGNYSGVEIINSSDERRGAACLIDNFLVLGKREQLKGVIDLIKGGKSLKASTQFVAASKPNPATSVIISFGSVKDESAALMQSVARLTKAAGQPSEALLDQLPLAASGTSISDRGLGIESHSPFGNFPFLVSIFAGAGDGR